MKSYHFDIGDSTNGAVGFCAEVEAETEEKAVEKLKYMLFDRESGQYSIDALDDVNEHVTFFVNPDFITASAIDDVEDI